MTECSNCLKPIAKGEPIRVAEFYEYKGSQKRFLGREIHHAEGHGCMVAEGEVNYPQDALPEGVDGKDARICACCKRSLPDDVEMCFQCGQYNRFEPKGD